MWTVESQGGVLDLHKTQDGHFLTLGSTNQNGTDFYYVDKYDQNGNKLWRNLFAESGSGTKFDLATDSLGNVYVMAIYQANVFVQRSTFLYKIEADGQTSQIFGQIARPESGNHSGKLIVDSQDRLLFITSLYTGGASISGGVREFSRDIVIRAFDSSGNLLEAKNFPEFADQGFVWDVVQDEDDNLYVLGDHFVATFNADHNLVKSIPLDSSMTGRFLTRDSEGNIYVAATKYAASYDLFLLKLTSQESPKVLVDFTTKDSYLPVGIGIDANNNVYLAGYISIASFTNRDTFLFKYNSSGKQIWQYSTKLDDVKDYAYRLLVQPSGELIFAYGRQNADGTGSSYISMLK
ncbi:MAG: hypothetical protein KC422_19080 [Trueperaceae bacterium]|nr:hypothetical protein [Trueperaceae bacterium]